MLVEVNGLGAFPDPVRNIGPHPVVCVLLGDKQNARLGHLSEPIVTSASVSRRILNAGLAVSRLSRNIAWRTLRPSGRRRQRRTHSSSASARSLHSCPRNYRVRRELATFMDAVALVDPMQYQRAPGEPDKPLRTLYFGPHNEGLVTFLVYPPDDLVLVTRIQWLGP